MICHNQDFAFSFQFDRVQYAVARNKPVIGKSNGTLVD